MFASNFPVDSVVASFEEIYRGFELAIEHLDDRQKHLLFVENALQTYRISPNQNTSSGAEPA